MKYYINCIFIIIFFPIYALFALVCALFARYICKLGRNRLVWGSIPIINYSYWSRAMNQYGFASETFTYDYYSRINSRSDWDRIISEQYVYVPLKLKPFVAFVESIFKYDIFFISFSGFFIGYPFVKYIQGPILKFARKKIVVLPYGADSYIYQRIRSTGTLHGLLMSYPLASRKQIFIADDVDYWARWADVILPGFMGIDGFGRWDALLPSTLSLDIDLWKLTKRNSHADGFSGKVIIAHAPNHRGFKGTEFLIHSIKLLQAEGLDVELFLLEGLQNCDVRKVLCEEVDILVEQLICPGHGLNALEGMASGLPTISNLEDDTYVMPMRRWSYFNECPLVSASPETLVDVLRKLITRPDLRRALGRAGRAYVEKYHGLDSAQYLFSNVIDYVYGRKESLINLYHPILGEYPNRSPKIQHPLVNSRIVD